MGLKLSDTVSIHLTENKFTISITIGNLPKQEVGCLDCIGMEMPNRSFMETSFSSFPSTVVTQENANINL